MSHAYINGMRCKGCGTNLNSSDKRCHRILLGIDRVYAEGEACGAEQSLVSRKYARNVITRIPGIRYGSCHLYKQMSLHPSADALMSSQSRTIMVGLLKGGLHRSATATFMVALARPWTT